MPFLIGPMCKKLRSLKYLTEDNSVLCINPKIVSIPLSVGSVEGEPLVNVGDEVKIGQMIALASTRFYVPFFASCSGKVIGIEKKMSARLKPCNHIVIENDFKDEKEYLEKTIDLNSSREEIIEFMKNIALLGQGGAGFPAYIKYNTDKCKFLLINAVECEPYLTADIRNINANSEDFYLGVKLMFKASNAEKCKIGIKEYHKHTIELLNNLFKNEENIEVCPVKDAYPYGWERTLVNALLNKHYDKLPIEVGAIVSNCTSAITLAKTSRERLPMYERFVTVSGENIKNPHDVFCRIGTSIKELIEMCGGVRVSPANILMGGPMMGTCVTKDEVCINTISNGVTIYKNEEIKPISCLRCGQCVEHCPSSLQPCSINEAFKINDVKRLEALHVLDCIECGMCTYICPSKIEVTENIRRAKRFYNLRRAK